MKTMFRCCDCGNEYPVQNSGATGYVRLSNGQKICYTCCAVRDQRRMIRTGKAKLYLVKSEGRWEVTNWPGSYRVLAHVTTGSHNIAGRRYNAWFKGPDGRRWYGVTYGDMTQLCHCRRTKYVD